MTDDEVDEIVSFYARLEAKDTAFAVEKLTPAKLREAAAYVREHGLLKNPDEYGEPGGRCCTFGTLDAIILTQYDHIDLNAAIENAWANVLRPGSDSAEIVAWNDGPATAQDVIDLFEATALRLEVADAT